LKLTALLTGQPPNTHTLSHTKIVTDNTTPTVDPRNPVRSGH